jgi:hypothetical protein
MFTTEIKPKQLRCLGPIFGDLQDRPSALQSVVGILFRDFSLQTNSNDAVRKAHSILDDVLAFAGKVAEARRTPSPSGLDQCACYIFSTDPFRELTGTPSGAKR